jgi:hypothetical protein
MRREGFSVDCAWAEARFSAAFDETLDSGDREALDRHLASCEACRRGHRDFNEATRRLRAYTPRAVPRAFIDSVRAAVAPAADGSVVGPAGRRRRPAWLAWGTAAAALVVAGWALLTRPDPVRIEVPVEVPVVREVVTERVVPVAIPVRGEGLSLVRKGETTPLNHGETVRLQGGDRLVVTEPPAPVSLQIDVRPLADTFSAWLEEVRLERRRRLARREARAFAGALAELGERMSDSARYLAEAAAAVPSRTPSPSVAAARQPATKSEPVARPASLPRVMLVPRANEVLVLETSGRASEVIPELIGLLDDDDARVAALARARLEEIQQRLTRAHGIRAPMRSAGPTEEVTGRGGFGRLFGKPTVRLADPSPGEQWKSWWDENREPIRLVCDARME